MRHKHLFQLLPYLGVFLVLFLSSFLMNGTALAAVAPSLKTSIVHTSGKTVTTVNWDQLDYRHSRYNPHETTISASNVAKLSVKWLSSIDDAIQSSPAVVNGVVYVVGFDGIVKAVNASTGNTLWTHIIYLPPPLDKYNDTVDHSSPAIANGVLYVGTDGGILYALSTKTGSVIWSYNASAAINSSPTVANGFVYFGAQNNKLIVLNATTGKVAWTYTTDAWVLGVSPAVLNNIVYASPNDTGMLALNASTGKLLWKARGFVNGAPSIVNNVIYGAYFSSPSTKSELAAINATTGAFLWKTLCAKCGVGLFFAVGNGLIYTGGSYYNPQGSSLPGTFSAYRMSNGSSVWNSTALQEATFDDAPALANGVVYSDDSGGEFVAYNAKTGAMLWTYQPGGEVHSSAVIANGTFYQCANDGNLYAFTI
jgi:eukaryotic-like serine/threonine-protein kinase